MTANSESGGMRLRPGGRTAAVSKISRSVSDCNPGNRSSTSWSGAYLPSRLLRLVFDTAAVRFAKGSAVNSFRDSIL